MVSWADATAFSVWLTRLDTQRDYRLPTEAEWERACRAGSGTPYWWGSDWTQATHYANVATSDVQAAFALKLAFPGDDGYLGSAPVATLAGSPWGLHDMQGNVREWCEDWYGAYQVNEGRDPHGPARGTDRILRGASWFDAHWDALRSARRFYSDSDIGGTVFGFRLACAAIRP